MTTLLDPARDWLAEEIRSRVVGPDPARSAAAIMDAPGPRWFADDAPIRRVHGDASMFAGGLRAILLQSLHPLAMAGVAQHSDYRHDPWGRLQRTAEFLAATTFGPIPVAERAVARVRSVHRHVTGTAADGRAYAANDPHLLRWVHVVEVDSFLTCVPTLRGATARPCPGGRIRARRRGRRSQARRQRGTDDRRRAPSGDPRVPIRTAGHAGGARRARFLLVEPPLPLAARAPYAILAATAVSLLPSWARWPLRLPYLPIGERLVVRPAGQALTQLIRWSLTSGPAPVADDRVEAQLSVGTITSGQGA